MSTRQTSTVSISPDLMSFLRLSADRFAGMMAPRMICCRWRDHTSRNRLCRGERDGNGLAEKKRGAPDGSAPDDTCCSVRRFVRHRELFFRRQHQLMPADKRKV